MVVWGLLAPGPTTGGWLSLRGWEVVVVLNHCWGHFSVWWPEFLSCILFRVPVRWTISVQEVSSYKTPSYADGPWETPGSVGFRCKMGNHISVLQKCGKFRGKGVVSLHIVFLHNQISGCLQLFLTPWVSQVSILTSAAVPSAASTHSIAMPAMFWAKQTMEKTWKFFLQDLVAYNFMGLALTFSVINNLIFSCVRTY